MPTLTPTDYRMVFGQIDVLTTSVAQTNTAEFAETLDIHTGTYKPYITGGSDAAANALITVASGSNNLIIGTYKAAGAVGTRRTSSFSRVAFKVDASSVLPYVMAGASISFNLSPISGNLGMPNCTVDVFQYDPGNSDISTLATGTNTPTVANAAYYLANTSLVRPNTLVAQPSFASPTGTVNITKALSGFIPYKNSQFVIQLTQTSHDVFPPSTTTTKQQSGFVISNISITVTTGAKFGLDPPTGLTVVEDPNNACNGIKLTWTPPASNGTYPLQGYILRWNAGSLNGCGSPGGYGLVNPSDVCSKILLPANQPFLITGIDAQCTKLNSRKIFVGLTAYNTNGNSIEATAFTSTTLTVCTVAKTALPPPTSISANMGSTIADLNWPSVSGATGYSVKWYLYGGASSSATPATVSGGSTTTYHVTGLTPSTGYAFEVYTLNGTILSTTSAATRGYTTATTVAPPTNLNATAGIESVTLTWTASATAGVSYSVTYTPGNVTTPTSATTLALTGLTGGTTYTFSVVATLGGNNSAPATTQAIPTSGGGRSGSGYSGCSGVIPDPPLLASVILTPNQNSIGISWSPSTSICTTEYSIQYSTSATGPFTTPFPPLQVKDLTLDGNGKYNASIKGLTSSTLYYVVVKAGNVF